MARQRVEECRRVQLQLAGHSFPNLSSLFPFRAIDQSLHELGYILGLSQLEQMKYLLSVKGQANENALLKLLTPR